MKWIKASEKMPDVGWKGVVRFNLSESGWCYGSRSSHGMNKSLMVYPETEWLDESLPASIEDEAKALYPDDADDGFKAQQEIYRLRNAHITCARMYTGEIERLNAALTKIEGIARRFGDSGTDPEKDIEVIEKLATEALKTTQ